MSLIKTNITGFYKDTKTNAIINTSNEYELIKAKRQQNKKVDVLETKVNKIESDLSDIKNLLLQLVDGKKNG